MLHKLLGTKIRHADPEVRIAAIAEVSPDDPVLAEIACDDTHTGVRASAIRRVGDLRLLNRLAAGDDDANVRGIAAARARELISGVATDGPPLTERLSALDASPDAGLARFVLEQGVEMELREKALARIDEPDVLAQAAIHDPAADLRRKALEKVTDEDTLLLIAREARQRDKRVAREARERVEALRDLRDRHKRMHEMCAQMEALSAGEVNPVAQARFTRLKADWAVVVVENEPALSARFGTAVERFQTHLAAQGRLKQASIGALKRLRALHQMVAEIETLDKQTRESVDAELAVCIVEWAEAGGGDGASTAEFDRLRGDLTRRRAWLQREQDRKEVLLALIAKTRDAFEKGKPQGASRLARVRERWQGLPKPEDGELRASLQAEFDALERRIDKHNDNAAAEIDRRLKEALAEVVAVEQALAAGEQVNADQHFRAAQKLLSAKDLPERRLKKLQDRLRNASPKLAEMSGWRHWGADRVREGLCEAAEALLGSERKPQYLAEKIRKLRSEWKKLDRNEGGGARKHWQRFDKACTAAYAPCKAFFEEQASVRAGNLEKKEALIREWEAIAADLESTTADLRAAGKRERQLLTEWRQSGPVDRRLLKDLEKRRSAVQERIAAVMGPGLEQERARREALTGQVRALVEDGDSAAAVVAAKQAQKQWNPRALLSRREEQSLWNEFRAVCDAAFELQRTQRDVQDEQRVANLAVKKDLCAGLEAHAVALAECAPGGTDPAELLRNAAAAVREVRTAWRAAGYVPRAEERAIEKRFAEATGSCEAAAKKLKGAKIEWALEAVRQRAGLCARAEAMIVAGSAADPDALASLAAAWTALAPSSDGAIEALEKRFALAMSAASGEQAAQGSVAQQDGIDTRRALCLRFEIAAGVDSPAEFEKERMEYRVRRLRDSLQGAQTGATHRQLTDIEREWYAAPGVAGVAGVELERRFQTALAASRAK